jgi:beta-phosphoglucomutase-like phosphatase (HAD superfamily)
MRFTWRVNSNNRVLLFVNTSGVRYKVATEEAATIEDALEGIKAARRAANVA